MMGIDQAARLPPRKVLIFTTGRCGSELLFKLLDAHPQMICEGEILNRSRRYPSLYVEWRSLRRTRLGTRARVYGWKVVTNDLWWRPKELPDVTSFLRQFTAPGSLLIALRRRNLLNQALSFIHADATDFHFVRGDRKKFEPLEVEPERLISTIHHYETHDGWLAKSVAGLDHLELTYEDDLSTAEAQRATTERVFSALGLRLTGVAADLISIAPQSPLDRVSNPDAVRRALAGTKYELYL